MSDAAFRPWFEEQPDRLEYELEALRARNWQFTVDQDAFNNGRLVLNGRVPVSDGERVLRISFPDTYPEHRVEIYDLTDDAVLPLHQHPYARNLCLLDNLPEAWVPGDDAAWMVERVLALRKAARDGVAGLERIGVGAPEPQSYYYRYTEGSSVLIPETVLGVKGDVGRFQLLTLTRADPVRGVIAEVSSHASGCPSVVKTPGAILELFHGVQITGAWFRLPEHPPFKVRAEEFRQWAHDSIPDFEKHLKREAVVCSEFLGLRLRAFALVYPDQGPEGTHDAWLICLVEAGEKRNKKSALLRPFVLSARDQERRIASLTGLRGKRVAVIGLGTVGAPIALELAKTGLLSELLLADYDYYTIWNLVRHPLNLLALGLDKAEALAHQARLFAPLLKIEIVRIRIGEAPLPESGRRESEALLLSKLQKYDLIIDATADGGTSRFLNRYSLQSGIPYLVASVTAGAWGGEVIRSIPGVTGCYECYLWELNSRAVPAPSQDTDRTQVFTRGCGFPTFTGTGFDALSLAADATRLAIQTLLRNEPGAYPDAGYDVLVRHNRGTDAVSCPRYESVPLRVHPKCAWHCGTTGR